MLDIKIKKVNRIENETGLFCLDDCIATVAGYYHQDYELMYVGGYELTGQEGWENFASQYQVVLKDSPENLWKYHGLKFTSYRSWSKKRLLKKIKKEIENSQPVMVLFDPFWCPWDLGFQRYSSATGHCFLIGEVTEQGLLCIDPYFEKESIELSYDFFWRGLRKLFLCTYKKRENLEKGKYYDLTKHLLQNLNTSNYFTKLKMLLTDMEASEDIFNEVHSEDTFWISPLPTVLLTVNQSMQNIAITFSYMAEKLDNWQIKMASERIWNLAIRWKQARKLIIKLFFMKREDQILKKRTLERMENIILELENIVKELFSMCLEERETEKSFEIEKEKNSEGWNKKSLALGAYRNNKAFLTSQNLQDKKMDADFSSIGNCYIWDENFKQKSCLEDIEYAVKNGEKDNVACNGQRVEVKQNNYSRINIIGSAEFGNSSDIIKLIFVDKSEYELEIQFTDYIFEPQFGEKVIWKGRGIQKEHGTFEWMKETLYLYEQQYDIPDKKLESIVLPINPSIHIFGITLEGDFTE